ncbi:MAG: RNA polymerase sigma factor [Chitinophagaceae bacterium]
MASGDLEIWLWNEIRYGNERALYQLYMTRYDSLVRYGLYVSGDKTKATDAINEVFTEIWIKRDRLPDVKEVGSYLFIIFKRKLSRLVHHKHTVLLLPEEEVLPELQQDGSYEDMLIALQSEEEQKLRVRHALLKLTSRQKELIHLRYFEEMSIDEIADKLNLSLRTIYNTLHSAISTLRKEMEKKR